MTERQATVLFANLSGSAELYAVVGETAAQPAVERCLALAAAQVACGGGRIVRRYGHGLMAIFGSPEAGAAAAAEIQGRLELEPAVAGVQLGLRIGLHHGPMVQQGNDVFGDHVNLASRHASLARKGEIVTSASTAALLPYGWLHFVRDLDRSAVKAGTDDIELVELLWRTEGSTSPPRHVPPARLCLRLEHQERTILRRRANDAARIGRDPDCALVVDREKVSRSHCTLERHEDRFVLKDHSTNGTYVTHEGEREVLVHRDKLVLGRHGWIALGQPRAAAPDSVEFFCA